MRRKPKPDTRASVNGVDMRAFKVQRFWFTAVAQTKLAALEAVASDVDAMFEARCAEFRIELDKFDTACADFVEYQSEPIEDAND